MACAHLNNPLTGGDSWDNSHNDVVRSILTPGSVTREKFITWLDRLADFALNLKDSKGELIPVIFRPLHEHTQGWSWWGSSCTTESEFVEFWQMIVTYLRDTKGVHNLLYAVSPQLDSWYDDQTIRDRLLYRWPGDNFVDFIGMDCYHGENPDAFSNYLRIVAFQVLTIASTTGFCTSDYELWNCPVAILIICAMMFPCGCGGSTAGGMKCSRLIVVGKHLINEIKHCVYPRTIASVRLSGERIDDPLVAKTLAFVLCYIALFIGVALLLTITEYRPNARYRQPAKANLVQMDAEGETDLAQTQQDPVTTDSTAPTPQPYGITIDVKTAFGASIAALSNIGPGFGHVGPSGDYHWFRPISKIILAITMITGRLELYTILVLFLPSFWRK